MMMSSDVLLTCKKTLPKTEESPPPIPVALNNVNPSLVIKGNAKHIRLSHGDQAVTAWKDKEKDWKGRKFIIIITSSTCAIYTNLMKSPHRHKAIRQYYKPFDDPGKAK